MQSEIDDVKTSSASGLDLENNDKLNEPAQTEANERNPNEPLQPKEVNANESKKNQPKEGNPDDPAKTQPMEGNPDKPANSQLKEGKTYKPANSLPNEAKPVESGNSQPHEGTPGEPVGQRKEKSDSEATMQSSDRHDQPQGGLQVQNKENPDGKQKKRKLVLMKKKNVSNGSVQQNQQKPVKAKLGQQKKAKLVKPEGSVQEKNLELAKVVEPLIIGETNVRDGTDQKGMVDENNGDLSKGDKNKKRRQRGKKGKGIAGSKMENLKQQTGEAGGSMNSGKMAGKLSLPDNGSRHEHDKKKEKLGGLIFMCSSKTKPDCFRYSVMGVSVNKKDLILRIKPGLKLFLYDFDLKLLYGVYRATSAGGMKLEPAAFGGAFPVQVKFDVFKDCYPLPESVFQKAIKENYNERRKFKTELTFEQVKKLTTLFRTVGVGSNSNTHTRTPPVKREETKAHVSNREYRPHSNQPKSNRDEYTNVNYRRESRKEESSRQPYLSERDYRTYGLLGRPRSRSPPLVSSSIPRLDHERDGHVRYPVSLYGDTTTSIHRDPLLVGRNETQPYILEGRQEITSSIHPKHTAFDGRRYPTHDLISPLDYQSRLMPAPIQNPGLESNRQQYLRPSYDLPDDLYSSAIRREEHAGAGPYYSLDGRRVVYLPEADSLRRREPEVAAFDHRQEYLYQEAPRPDPVYTPVSSRYSFAGPSSYR